MTATQNMYLHSTNFYAKKMIEFEPWGCSTPLTLQEYVNLYVIYFHSVAEFLF